MGTTINKQQILEECISLAYKINEFGAYVFFVQSPHVHLTEFMVFKNKWKNGAIYLFNVSIYKTEGYQDYPFNFKKNKPNTVGELHYYLTKLLKEKKEQHKNDSKSTK